MKNEKRMEMAATLAAASLQKKKFENSQQELEFVKYFMVECSKIIETAEKEMSCTDEPTNSHGFVENVQDEKKFMEFIELNHGVWV